MTNKHKSEETIIWKAPSHIAHERTSAWYLGFALVFIGLLVFAITSKSWLAFATFVLIVLVLLILNIQPPTENTYRITKTEIIAGSAIYPFSVIKKFWIIYNPPHIKTLNLETSAYLNNKVTIQLGNQDPVEVKLILSEYLIEDLDKAESLSETLARRLKI